jgi:hypothetical protein
MKAALRAVGGQAGDTVLGVAEKLLAAHAHDVAPQLETRVSRAASTTSTSARRGRSTGRRRTAEGGAHAGRLIVYAPCVDGAGGRSPIAGRLVPTAQDATDRRGAADPPGTRRRLASSVQAVSPTTAGSGFEAMIDIHEYVAHLMDRRSVIG